MSIELLIVFALKAPPSGASLQAALDREPNPVRLADATSLVLTQHTGLLPARYKSFATGFYVYQSSSEEFFRSYPEAKSLREPISAVISFQVGGNPLECVAAAQVASTLASGFGAKVFDPQGGGYISAHNLKTIAQVCEDQAQSQRTPQVVPKP